MNWTRICVPYTASKHHARCSSNATLTHTPHRVNVTTAAAAAVATLLFAVAVAMSATLAPRPAQAQTMPNPAVCDRTPQIRDAIVTAIDGVTSCTGVTSAHLLSIRFLGADDTGLTALQSGDFNGMTGLVTLQLFDNRLTTLPDGIFDGLTDLEDLWIWNNDIRDFSNDVFAPLSSIEGLHIHGNEIRSLHVDTFKNLNTLEALNIGANDLTSLPKDILRDTDALIELYIYDNDITSLDRDTFDGLSNLTTLWLGGNSMMTSLPADIFDGLSALKEIRMAGLSTEFQYPDGLLAGLTNLEAFHAGDLRGVDPARFDVNLVRNPIDPSSAKLQIPVGAPLDAQFEVWVLGHSSGSEFFDSVASPTILTGATESDAFTLPTDPHPDIPSFINSNRTIVVQIVDITGYRQRCGETGFQYDCHTGFGFTNNIPPPECLDRAIVSYVSAGIVCSADTSLSGSRLFYQVFELFEVDPITETHIWVTRFHGIHELTTSNPQVISLQGLAPDKDYLVDVYGLSEDDNLSMSSVPGFRSVDIVSFRTVAQPQVNPLDVEPTFDGETLTWRPAASRQALLENIAEVSGTLAYQARFKKSAETTWSDWEEIEAESTEDGNLTAPLYRLEGGVSYDIELRRAITGLATFGGPERDFTDPVSRTIFTFIPIPAVNRIEPSTLEVSVRAGERVRLSADVYDSQDQLANEHADNGEGGFERWQPDLEWSSDSGGSFEESSNGRSTVYTAPSLPGVYTVTAEVGPPGLCRAHHPGVETQDGDPCTARFTVRVSREASPATPAPDPVNPSFAIPTTVSDDAGTKFSVFTPVAGGTFSGTGITISAGPGAVPDRAALAVAAAETDAASPSETANAEFILHGKTYDVVAMSRTDDTSWSTATQYRLDAPLTACLTVPWESANGLSSITVVEIKSDGLVGPLTSNLRSVDGGTAACGTLSRVPATLALATRADAAMEPTAAPTAAATPRELPAAGGSSLTVNTLALVLLSGLVVVAVAVASAVAMKARRPARTRATE